MQRMIIPEQRTGFGSWITRARDCTIDDLHDARRVAAKLESTTS
jgi:hypothetical protein